MNDNENKTNAPTIKLPVRFASDSVHGGKVVFRDAGGMYLFEDGYDPADGITLSKHEADGRAERHQAIAAALNEADALRAEVEGYRELFDAVPVWNGVHFQRGEMCRTNNGWMYLNPGAARWIDVATALEAYAAIKPNAAAGEEGTE